LVRLSSYTSIQKACLVASTSSAQAVCCEKNGFSKSRRLSSTLSQYGS
jgi:hypothetical protein